jgi:hypothetical protein
MTNRNRREDLLKVADLFFMRVDIHEGQYVKGCLPIRDIVEAFLGFRITCPSDGTTLEEEDYARALFAELPAFLKAEWHRLREFESGVYDSVGEEDEYGA